MRRLFWLLIVGLISQRAGAEDPFSIQTPPKERMAGFTVTLHDETPVMVWCPPGTFTMGSPESEEYRDKDEQQAQVTLTQGFWMGRDEVTQAQWESVMKTKPWRDRKSAEDESIPEDDNFPATCVDWQSAIDFCEKLTEHERKAGRLTNEWKYALPTEAQWEYACRAGATSAYCFGDDPESEIAPRIGDGVAVAGGYGRFRRIDRYAWYNLNVKHTFFVYEKWVKPHAQKVRRKEPNAWAIHDMHGNVWEWCLDSYQPNLPGGKDPLVVEKSNEKNAPAVAGRLSLDSATVLLTGLSEKKANPSIAGSKVIRGGAWRSPYGVLRSAKRNALNPTVRADYYGFRVVLVPIAQ